jgi:uncharacterized membrane protein YphA (DoxX/SURF4 family)
MRWTDRRATDDETARLGLLVERAVSAIEAQARAVRWASSGLLGVAALIGLGFVASGAPEGPFAAVAMLGGLGTPAGLMLAHAGRQRARAAALATGGRAAVASGRVEEAQLECVAARPARGAWWVEAVGGVALVPSSVLLDLRRVVPPMFLRIVRAHYGPWRLVTGDGPAVAVGPDAAAPADTRDALWWFDGATLDEAVADPARGVVVHPRAGDPS